MVKYRKTNPRWRKPRSERYRNSITLVINDVMLDWIEDTCHDQNLTMSELVRQVIEQHIEREEKT